MHAVVRTYSGQGAKELFELLEQRKADVERIIRSVSGLQSYSLIRTAEGGISVTVCQNKSGTDESVRLAAEWVRENASELATEAPDVSDGTVVLQLD
ncbi:MAG: hypothetical protein QNJ06_09400 [Kiloniellales bacterium]|nr:hypothetical protein [Kiloniellales bacterium]MDJ0970106.1 hypothetical protein [Kiloniellales bacterium]MDJ0980084.1 hypothetical protein [Kiloniellales bacterium]